VSEDPEADSATATAGRFCSSKRRVAPPVVRTTGAAVGAGVMERTTGSVGAKVGAGVIERVTGSVGAKVGAKVTKDGVGAGVTGGGVVVTVNAAA